MKKKILFLIPTYKYIPSRGFVSLARLLLNIPKVYDAKFGLGEGMYIALSRSLLAERYYLSLPTEERDSFDLICWIDDDMVFSPDDVQTLVDRFETANADVLSGLYFSRSSEEPVAYTLNENDKRYVIPLPKERGKGIVSCDATGFGFLAMKPSVLDRMKAQYGKWMFRNDIMEHADHPDGMHLGEDVYFFKNAKELGIRVAVDTDLVIGHDGGLIR